MKKVKSYFKSKKGLSLAELLCAICIMAIAVAAASSGLAVSYQAIMAGTLREQAAADAQRACDVIMTCVEYTPSNEPGYTSTLALSIADKVAQDDKNLLFAKEIDEDYTLTNADEPGKTEGVTVTAFKSICDGLNITDVDTLHQYKNESDYRIQHDWESGDISFVIENDGGFSYNKVSGSSTTKVRYVNYKITTYVDYGKNKIATCVGSVSKPALCE